MMPFVEGICRPLFLTVEGTVAVCIGIEGIGLSGIAQSVAVGVFESILDSIAVTVGPGRICFANVEYTVAVPILFSIQ